MKIYILQEEGTSNYKIGHTKNSVKSRIKGLQTGNPNKIIEYYSFESEFAIKIEHSLHFSYSIYNKTGEWFKLSESQLKNIKESISKMDSNLTYLKENKI